MGTITKIAEFYLLSLALGCGIFSPVASSLKTGHGFLKVLHGVCLGAMLIASLVHGSFFIPYLIVLASFIFVLLFHRDQKSLLMWALYFAQNILLLSLLYSFAGSNVVHFLYLVSSALLLGVVTYAMTLGHWYLVVFDLSEKPLLKATYLFWGLLLLKLFWSLFNLSQNWEWISSPDNFEGDFSFFWPMVLMRFLWGYFILGILSYFSWRLIKMRSIQSATGILYVMTFFVFVGELISTYLHYKYGISL